MLHLEARGDLKTLIAFVEQWTEVAEPTGPARLAQARAFLGLCLLDRAWVRLRDMLDRGEADAEVHALTARMFQRRGWQKKARQTLQSALAEHPDDRVLQAMWDDLAPAAPPAVDELKATDDQRIELAEHYMCTGALVRARSLLEGMRKRGVDRQRIGDLLWAMDGDFGLGEATLGELAHRFGPDLATLADLPDEAEHTEAASMEPPAAAAEHADNPFPVLFRNLEPPTEAYRGPTEVEVTAVSSMAEVRDLLPAGVGGEEGEDTQVVHVFGKDGLPEGLGSDSDADVPANLDDSSWDLSAFRPTPIKAPPTTGSDYGDAPEGEDEDVIIVTKQESEEATRRADRARRLSLESTAEAPARGHRVEDEAAVWVAATAPGVAAEEQADEVTAPRGPRRPRPQRTAQVGAAWQWWLAAFVALLATGVLAFGLVVAYQVLRSVL